MLLDSSGLPVYAYGFSYQYFEQYLHVVGWTGLWVSVSFVVVTAVLAWFTLSLWVTLVTAVVFAGFAVQIVGCNPCLHH